LSINPVGAVYGQIARFRRHWYEKNPARQRQVGCPVISVGNLVMGGSGKTPVVAAIVTLLRERGYSPAILSRGYKRRSAAALVVVSDGQSVVAGVDASGDEPQMLARRLPGVPVIVSADRYRAGVMARDRLGANVLVLDDGFQHLRLARTVNLLLLSRTDAQQQVFPGGPLREPIDAAASADALLVADDDDPATLGRAVGVNHTFSVFTTYQPLRSVAGFAVTAGHPTRVITLAGIARPARFAASVRARGFTVLQELSYPDHHWYTPTDVKRVEEAARAAGAEAILTTEKDAVRLEPLVSGAMPMMFLPIDAQIEPGAAFQSWLLDRIGPPGTYADRVHPPASGVRFEADHGATG
jgi:tetraacyldisaccharide 4'-kinase